MALSKTRRAELEAELLQTMDKLDALKVELREQLQDHRVQVKLHAEKLRSLRDILSGREGEQLSVPGTESGTVKPAAARPAKKEKSFADGGRHASWKPARGELTRWTCDAQAKRVPVFVIEQTGLYTKADVIRKYGDGVTFEKGKPTPRLSADKSAPKKPRPAPITGLVSWTEGDGTQQVMVGSTTYRAQEITPTRWVLESKSERERAWHKEAVLPSLAECEAWLMVRHDGVSFAEGCLNCGIAADQPSDGCTECQHGRPA